MVEFNKPGQDAILRRRLKRYYPDDRLQDGENEISHLTREWIRLYFEDKRDPGIDIPLDIRGTDFEVNVWCAIHTIPFGSTRSYKDIAEQISSPKSARAVGGATGRNPVAIIIPCHRVIGSNGTLTGYGGGLHRKRFLLNHER